MGLKDVCVGDKVVIRSCGGAGQETIKHSTVVKVTKTQITVKDGVHNIKFLKNGVKFGKSNKHYGWFTFLYTEDEWNE